MELQLLFLFRHLVQLRAIFPYELQTTLCWICGLFTWKCWWTHVTLHLTLRCQSCTYPGLKHCRGKRALYINHLVLKCLFGREPAQEMRWQDAGFFFFLPGMLLAMAALPHLSLSGCVTLTSAVTWLVQLQLRRTLCFSSNPLESNKVQQTRRQSLLQQQWSP